MRERKRRPAGEGERACGRGRERAAGVEEKAGEEGLTSEERSAPHDGGSPYSQSTM